MTHLLTHPFEENKIKEFYSPTIHGLHDRNGVKVVRQKDWISNLLLIYPEIYIDFARMIGTEFRWVVVDFFVAIIDSFHATLNWQTQLTMSGYGTLGYRVGFSFWTLLNAFAIQMRSLLYLRKRVEKAVGDFAKHTHAVYIITARKMEK
jgi:hypothetical protein